MRIVLSSTRTVRQSSPRKFLMLLPAICSRYNPSTCVIICLNMYMYSGVHTLGREKKKGQYNMKNTAFLLMRFAECGRCRVDTWNSTPVLHSSCDECGKICLDPNPTELSHSYFWIFPAPLVVHIFIRSFFFFKVRFPLPVSVSLSLSLSRAYAVCRHAEGAGLQCRSVAPSADPTAVWFMVIGQQCPPPSSHSFFLGVPFY